MNWEPKVDIVVPCYNVEHIINKCIKSLLRQSYNNDKINIYLVNDGSTDSSNEIINSYRDKRIVSIEQENTGLPVALNLAISKAKGDFIARMDSDDIADPSRIKKQLEHLNQKLRIYL